MDETGAPFQDLRRAYEDGNLIVFAGAGVSTAGGLPSAKELAARLLDRLRGGRASADAIAEIEALLARDEIVDALSALKLSLGDLEFYAAVERALDDGSREVPEIARAIAALRPRLRAVLTTNLDGLLERAFEGRWPFLARAVGDIGARRHYILKLRGTLLERDTWVFSRDEHDRAAFASPHLREALGALLRTCPILFVGCDFGDELEGLLAEVRALSGEQPPNHFALVPGDLGPYHRAKLEQAGVRLIVHEGGDALRSAAALLRRLPEPPPGGAPRDRSAGAQGSSEGKLALHPEVERLAVKTRRRPSDGEAEAARDRRGPAHPVKLALRGTRAHLLCDRHEPWEKLRRASQSAHGHAVFLCGDLDAGHSYFLERVESFGSAELDAEIVWLGSDVYEDVPYDLEVALEDALPEEHLQGGSGRVASAVARLLARRNVVLLFPSVGTVRDHDRWLKDFYTKAFPDFVAKVHGSGPAQKSLIAVQPIRWRSTFFDRLPLFSARRRARRLLEVIAEARRPTLEIWIEELSRIEREHIEALFHEIYAANPTKATQRIRMAAELVGQKPSVIFENLEQMVK